MSRTDTTAMPSEPVEKRPKNHVSFRASEVNLDLGTSKNRRIDSMGFKPITPGHAPMPASMEPDESSCHEAKSRMADSKPGHGPTFHRDVNHLATTREPAEEPRVNYLPPRNTNQMPTPSKKNDKLAPLFDVSGKRPSHRRRAASEMPYTTIEANGKRTN